MNKDLELAKYRVSLADDTLRNAKMCLDNNFYRDCINRSYYATFYAIRAVLAIEGIDFKRHKEVIGYFNKTYVATEKFSKEIGKKLGRIKTVREESDYNDFFIASEQEAKEQIQTAELIIEAVKGYLEGALNEKE